MSSPQFVSPFGVEGNWYKANLHTHTTESDGHSTPGERVEQYRGNGYSVLAITDHRTVTDVDGLSTDDFLVIRGTETHPECGEGADLYHLVCINVPQELEFPEDSDANTRVGLVEKAGGMVILAHPYWCGHNINHILRVEGFTSVEVYNGTCTKNCKGFSSVHWDDMLDAGRIVSAVAVDDVHKERDIFMGWVMIRAESLTVESIMNALRTGCFYSSCGPVIEDFGVEDGRLFLRCSPVSEAHFVCNRHFGKSFYSDDGEPITAAETAVKDDMVYVRAEVVDARGNRAWTNPIMLR